MSLLRRRGSKLAVHREVEVEVETAAGIVTATESLVVAPSTIHGLGVFAARDFEPEDVVEVCPVVVCPGPDETHLEQTSLRGLYFHWHDESVAVALGYGSLYNHAWQSNARYEPDVDAEVIRFIAVRPVAAGEELTVNYTGDPEGVGNLWFDPDVGDGG